MIAGTSSPVERSVRDREVEGSIPSSPILNKVHNVYYYYFINI